MLKYANTGPPKMTPQKSHLLINPSDQLSFECLSVIIRIMQTGPNLKYPAPCGEKIYVYIQKYYQFGDRSTSLLIIHHLVLR